MKLAECLLQERPIKRDGMTHWYKPVIKSEMCANALCGSQLMGLESLDGETMFFLNAKDFAHGDWEIKPITLAEKILELMRDYTRPSAQVLTDIRVLVESGNYTE